MPDVLDHPLRLTHRSATPRAPARLTRIAWALLALLQGAAWAQQEGGENLSAPKLRSSPLLMERRLSEAARREVPTYVSGDEVTGQVDQTTVIEGHALLRRGDTVIRADRMEYRQPDDIARATGHVHVNRAGDVYEGPELEVKVEEFKGYFLQPSYQFLRNGAHGEASRADFIDEKHAVVYDANYTTCRRTPGPSWMPDWILRATRLDLDSENDVGRAEGGVLDFKGVPILPFPGISFPLSDRRKSGLLPPTFGLDSVNGIELTVPYYLDIAPNRDATLFPTVMSRRGVELGTEVRYLESAYRGQARLNLMPADKLRDRDRWGFSAQHTGTLPLDMPSVGPVGINLNLNRVSDDNYWRDFRRAGQVPALMQRLLPNDGTLSWAQGAFSVTARALRWQALQDVNSPMVPPYDRMPQVTGRYASDGPLGLAFAVEADTTRFQADARLTGQPNAQRSYLLGQVSRPWVRPWGFFTPKLQLHETSYQFDTALASGALSATRSVPTFSLDSGLILERDASFFGRALRQTLEPRAFYVRTPFRDQSQLPVYDTGANSFSFATLYTENAFVGQDRIADNNLLTLGVTTRLLDAETGAEAVRLGVAQRLRFSDQNVTLPGAAPVSERLSDMLVGAAINWDKRWGLDSMVQFNPKTQQSERTTVGVRYQPGDYKLINAAYRLQRGTSEQVDLGWQWPVSDLWTDRPATGTGPVAGRWYSVGRLNYSLQDRKLVDTIVGVEYDGGCWVGRIVFEQLHSTIASSAKRILFLLEFDGFSRLGSNPLRILRENIPRYQPLREQTTTPSRFGNYE